MTACYYIMFHYFLGGVSSGSVDEDLMEKDDQMDITDENEINITDDVNITDESSEAQDLTMAGRANVNGGKIAANTPPSSPPPSSTNNGVSLLLNSALTNAAANGGSEAYQNSMLGILINKFGINGLQVRHYYYHNFRIKNHNVCTEK